MKLLQKPNTSRSLLIGLAILFQLVAPAKGNLGQQLACDILSMLGNWLTPQIKTIIFEEVKEDLQFELPFKGGDFGVTEPGDPEFEGCTFTIPMNMALDSKLFDIKVKDAATLTLEGTMQPTFFGQGLFCMQDIKVVDYGVDGMDPVIPDFILDNFFGGDLPALPVSDQTCVSLIDLAGMALNATLASFRGDDGDDRRLRQRAVV